MQRDDDDLCQCPLQVGPHWETEECREQQAALDRMTTRLQRAAEARAQ